MRNGLLLGTALIASLVLGCQSATSTSESQLSSEEVSQYREKFVSDAEPDELLSLLDVYEKLKPPKSDDAEGSEETADKTAEETAEETADEPASEPPSEVEVAVVARVGKLADSDDPADVKAKWLKNSAEFKIVDPADDGSGGHAHDDPDHECPFCSSTGTPLQTIVRFLNEEGQPLPVDARKLFQFEDEDLIVVRGTARLEPGNLVIEGKEIVIRR